MRGAEADAQVGEARPTSKKMSPKKQGSNSQVTPPSSSLYVHGLPLALDSESLRTFFSQFGEVRRTTRVIKNRGYGFVDFDKPESAEAALNAASSSTPLKIGGLYIRLERVKGGEATESTSGNGGSWTTSSTSDQSQATDPTSSRRLVSDPLKVVSHRKPGQTLEMELESRKRSIRIQYVPSETTVDDLKKVFSVHGVVRYVSLKNTSRSSAGDSVLRVARSVYEIEVSFDHPDSAAAARSFCESESVSVTVIDSITLRIGPYSSPPSLIEAMEFLSPCGSLVSAQVVQDITEAIIEFENETSVDACLKHPVFVRGCKLVFVPCIEPNDGDDKS